MAYRLLLCYLCFLPLLIKGQILSGECCFDATCATCEEIQVCQGSPYSPLEADPGGTAACGVSTGTLCSTFWENNVYGVSNEMPATEWNPSGCLIISCGDPLASNYNPIYGPFVPTELQDCIYPVQASTYCLDGTTWHEELGGCVVESPTDTDLDGCTGVGDVLDVLANFGFCIDTATASVESIPAAFYSDSDVLLLLDFNTGTIDASSFSRNVTLSNYELGPDRFGTPNSALHAIDSMPQYIQGDCNDVVVNGFEPTNCVLLDPPVAILADDNDEYALSMWIEHPNIVYDEGCFQSMYSSLFYGLVPIDNPPEGNTTVCYYSSSLNFGLDNWSWDGQACPYSSLSLSGWYLQGASWYGDTCFMATNPPELLPQHPYKTGWNHIAISKSNDNINVYVNGQIRWQSTINADEQDSFRHYGALGFPNITLSNHDFIIELIRGLKESIGQSTNYYAFDDILVLNRALTDQEVIDLYTPGQEAMNEGCMSCDACNYDSLASVDDGSCDYSCYGCMEPSACNYNESSTRTDNSCFFQGDTCSDGNALTCGDTYNENCQCIGTTILGAVESPCQGETLVTYNNYNYEIIELNGQCWFSENLRSEAYSNGDPIPSALIDCEWEETTEGAFARFGENEFFCYESVPEFNACSPDLYENTFGLLYNRHAILDSRNICPTGWHVSTDCDWLGLEFFMGVPEDELLATGYRGNTNDVANSIKSTEFWWQDYGDSNGSDLYGFDGRPGGARSASDGGCRFAGARSYWWTSSSDGLSWYRNINWSGTGIGRNGFGSVSNNFGFSVRCVKD